MKIVLKLHFLFIVSCWASPVIQDEQTTPYPLLQNDVISEEATTSRTQDNEVVPRGADASDPDTFRYPQEPEAAQDGEIEKPLEDGVPKDFDISTMDLTVVALKNPNSEIFSGRAGCQCGVPGDRKLPLRIINGTVVPINELPWTVALTRKSWLGESNSAYCGATLINSHYVLTASHCVDGMVARNIEVRVHEEDFSSNTEVEGGTQKIPVERIVMHPFYNRRTIDNDIALLKLSREVMLGGVVVPACLPANNEYTFEGQQAIVAGWGATSEGSSVSSTLMKVDVPIISNKVCNTDTKYVGKITDNMMCAGYMEGGKDSCQGDSGGPLTIPNGGRTTLVGIVSWGYGCARPKSPGVYTRTGKYSQWIVANSKGAKWCNA